MKKIPSKVIAACSLGAACVVVGGTLALAAPELKFVSKIIAWLGLAAVAFETFNWGAQEGYAIRGKIIAVRVENVLRCLAMSAIMVLVSVLAGSVVLQAVFEMFFR